MDKIIDEMEGFYKIITFSAFRKTKGVTFDMIPINELGPIDALDRVLHERKAISPEPVGDVVRPWYMHPDQDDNLVVLYGTREVDIYSTELRKIEHFTITPEAIYKNGHLLYNGGCMLVWPRNVFHRIVSGEEGSASINFARHYDDFNLDTNFNIYDLNTETGDYHVIRQGLITSSNTVT